MNAKSSSIKRSEMSKKLFFYIGNIVIGLIFISPLLWMIGIVL